MGPQAQGLHHRPGDAALLAPFPDTMSQDSGNRPGKHPQGSKRSSPAEGWAISPKICV